MNAILVKLFATALALSQVTTDPNAVKTSFDPVDDVGEVVRLLQGGCDHIRKVFDVEDIKLDDLITTAMDDPEAMSGGVKALHGLKFDELFTAYRQFCKNETVEHSPVDIAEVIRFYDKALVDLPDTSKIKDVKLPGMSVVLDGSGGRFAELGEPDHRRIVVPLAEIPELVQKAFVAAEDKRFFQHKGIDERGMMRAFVGNLAHPGRPEGGSTITQQVAKNLLVGDDVTYERKIREIVVASRLEQSLSKPDILALYLNLIYLGRSSYGVEMAARSYFGKPAKDLSLAEAALLAGLPKGPNYFNPDLHPNRARERLSYVLDRMQEDGAITTEQMDRALTQMPRTIAYDRPRRDGGFYFLDHLGREAKTLAGIDGLASDTYTIHSTLRPAIQRATEAALQEGLARYEMRTGRVRFQKVEANLADTVARITADGLLEARGKAESGTPASNGFPADAPTAPQSAFGDPPRAGPLASMPPWQQALETALLPLHDVHWPIAIIIAVPDRNSGFQVGLRDGRVLPLKVPSPAIRRALKLYDVVFVQISDGKDKNTVRADLRVRPTVQGAALVMENKTGRILAMTGGFSYSLSQLNRVTQSRRQPGSTMKPISYLAALEAGLQPNTLLLNEPITLPPIRHDFRARDEDYWSPANYEGSRSGGAMTLRRGLERSVNLVTAHLLDGAISDTPQDSLDRVCALATAAQLYKKCERYYPFVLGAQPVRMIDLAAFYATVANEGERPTPYAIDSIEQKGIEIYRHDATRTSIGLADPAAFYQLKTMLQGVVERGTARPIQELAPYIAGKTGTTEDSNDAWFVGFTNDVTVAVWVGYDNADGERRTLGDGETGAKVAIPIFKPIIQAVWAQIPRALLAPPSPQARRNLIDLRIDLASGKRISKGSQGGFLEHFRRSSDGEIDDTEYRFVSREDAYGRRDSDPDERESYGNSFAYNPESNSYQPRRRARRSPQPPAQQLQLQPQQLQPQPQQGFLNPFWWGDNDRQRPRRLDPNYPFWNRRLY
jgi:penicillin-binding protein 1A